MLGAPYDVRYTPCMHATRFRKANKPGLGVSPPHWQFVEAFGTLRNSDEFNEGFGSLRVERVISAGWRGVAHAA